MSTLTASPAGFTIYPEDLHLEDIIEIARNMQRGATLIGQIERLIAGVVSLGGPGKNVPELVINAS